MSRSFRVVVLASAMALAVGCAVDEGSAAGPPPTTTERSNETPSTVPSSADTVTEVAGAPRCPPWTDDPVALGATDLREALRTHLTDPRLVGTQVGVSVWVDGLGEVLAHGADDRLLVASNQKLLTAMGVLDAIPLDTTFRTEVVASNPDPATGVVPGDLVLVGGGDPTLTSTGPHSLAALAAAVRAAGIREVRGALLVDESRYDASRSAPGWQDWHIPTYAGPMSALIVDDNRGRTDAPFLVDPARGHGDAFRERLAAAGVSVAGPVSVGTAPAEAVPVAVLESAPMGDLLGRMLLASDNEVSESLTREAGVLLAGVGTTPAGTGALEARLLDGCAPLTPGGWGDGSGMSRSDLRSARELRRLLQHARSQPWWPELRDRLPVAGRTGTLASRFSGTAAEGRVVAKTGTIIGGSALTGIITTASGREATFSVIVNGDGSPAAIRALDEIVVTLAAS